MLILRYGVFAHCWKLLSQKGCLPQYFSLLLSITHKLQAASDDYLKHRVFFFLSNLSMRDRQQPSTLIGTKSQKRGGEGALLPSHPSHEAWNSLYRYSPTCLNGDLALSATRARPQEFPKNSRIWTQGNTWVFSI